MAFPDELLAGDEHPQLVVSPHGSEVVGPLLWTLVAIPFWYAANAYRDIGLLVMPLAVVAVVFGVGGLITCVARVVHWQTTLYAITNHRVIVRDGLVARDSRDVPLYVIQDVRIRQGVIARVFGVGNLELQSAAVGGHTELRWLPQVLEVRRLLHGLVQSLPKPEPMVPLPAGGSPPSDPNLVSQLQRLSELRTAGHLTEDEFNAAKRRLLGGQPEVR